VTWLPRSSIVSPQVCGTTVRVSATAHARAAMIHCFCASSDRARKARVSRRRTGRSASRTSAGARAARAPHRPEASAVLVFKNCETSAPDMTATLVRSSSFARSAPISSSIWINTKSTGAIERIFNARVGESLFGAVSVRYGLAARPIEIEPAHDGPRAMRAVPAEPDGATTVELHPAYQRRRFRLVGAASRSARRHSCRLRPTRLSRIPLRRKF